MNPAICVFGIYTDAQMERAQFWDILSQQLQNKGPDYVGRCTFRNPPSDTGDNSILPASFPPRPIQELQEILPLVKAREEDLKNVSEKFCFVFLLVCIYLHLDAQIHSMLVYVPAELFIVYWLTYNSISLEKFVILSQVMSPSVE